MDMLKKLFQRLGRHRIILDRESNDPYLERYYLFLKDRKHFPFNIFLHKFLKGDRDHLHDHPWSYCTLILKGGYWEWIPGDNCQIRKWRGVGHFRRCAANSYHRIELEPGVTAWTLFMPGQQQRDWGFLVDDVWIQNEEYFTQRKENVSAQLL